MYERNHSSVFHKIRDGLLETIDLEKSCGIDQMPFDMGLDPWMDSPVHFAKRPPEAVFIPAGSVSRDAHGHRYGSELLELNDAMIDKLQNGHQLAVEICQGEYILFIQYCDKELSIQ